MQGIAATHCTFTAGCQSKFIRSIINIESVEKPSEN
jgi:hypothetical protein